MTRCETSPDKSIRVFLQPREVVKWTYAPDGVKVIGYTIITKPRE